MHDAKLQAVFVIRSCHSHLCVFRLYSHFQYLWSSKGKWVASLSVKRYDIPVVNVSHGHTGLHANNRTPKTTRRLDAKGLSAFCSHMSARQPSLQSKQEVCNFQPSNLP